MKNKLKHIAAAIVTANQLNACATPSSPVVPPPGESKVISMIDKYKDTLKNIQQVLPPTPQPHSDSHVISSEKYPPSYLGTPPKKDSSGYSESYASSEEYPPSYLGTPPKKDTTGYNGSYASYSQSSKDKDSAK